MDQGSNNINHCIISITTNEKIKIKIFFNNVINKVDTSQFINDYKISNFWKGKFFVKNLIRKIFKYKINKKMDWSPDFWEKIVVYNYKIKIDLCDKENINNFNELMIKNTTPRRFNDIKRYKIKLSENIDLGSPLFISGKCLNSIGGSIDEHSIFILDGSRRLVANILNNTTPNIFLIDIKNK